MLLTLSQWPNSACVDILTPCKHPMKHPCKHPLEQSPSPICGPSPDPVVRNLAGGLSSQEPDGGEDEQGHASSQGVDPHRLHQGVDGGRLGGLLHLVLWGRIGFRVLGFGGQGPGSGFMAPKNCLGVISITEGHVF